MSAVERKDGFQLTGRHVLFAMLGFFGVIFAVNGVFLYQAIGSYTGLVADEPYRKGLNYNDRILEAAVQHTLGWKHKLTVSKDGLVQIALADRDGTPVSELEVNVAISRPSTARGEVNLTLKSKEPGLYEGAAGQLPLGNLVSAIEVKRLARDGQMVTTYRAKERIWLKP
ncbi:MAG: FixH family protein [Pseudomonadota bacterium]